MSDVVIMAAEIYSKIVDIDVDTAMSMVVGAEPPLPGTENELAWSIDQAYIEGR